MSATPRRPQRGGSSLPFGGPDLVVLVTGVSTPRLESGTCHVDRAVAVNLDQAPVERP